MQEREIAKRFEAGEIRSALIKRHNEQTGWTVTLLTTNNETIGLRTKRETSPRLFKTSDAALRWCGRIGFREASVEF